MDSEIEENELLLSLAAKLDLNSFEETSNPKPEKWENQKENTKGDSPKEKAKEDANNSTGSACVDDSFENLVKDIEKDYKFYVEEPARLKQQQQQPIDRGGSSLEENASQAKAFEDGATNVENEESNEETLNESSLQSSSQNASSDSYLEKKVKRQIHEHKLLVAMGERLKQDCLERMTILGLELDDLKLENIAKRKKLRAIENRKGIDGHIQTYEEEIQRLEEEVMELRKKQGGIILSILDHHEESAKKNGFGVGTVSVLRRSICEAENKAAQLHAYIYETLKKKRSDMLVGIELEKNQQALIEITKSNKTLDSELKEERLLKAEYDARIYKGEKLSKILENSGIELRELTSKSHFERQRMEVFAATVHKEKKRQTVVDNFVRKHSTHEFCTGQNMSKVSDSMKHIRAGLQILEEHSGESFPGLLPLVTQLKLQTEKLSEDVYKAYGDEQDAMNALIHSFQNRY